MEEGWGCNVRIMDPWLVSGFAVLVTSESSYSALLSSGTKLDFLFSFHSFIYSAVLYQFINRMLPS